MPRTCRRARSMALPTVPAVLSISDFFFFFFKNYFYFLFFFFSPKLKEWDKEGAMQTRPDRGEPGWWGQLWAPSWSQGEGEGRAFALFLLPWDTG